MCFMSWHARDKLLVYVSRFAVECRYNMMRESCFLFSDATPFLQKVQEILFSQILKMPDTFSVTALLDTWVRDWYSLGALQS